MNESSNWRIRLTWGLKKDCGLLESKGCWERILAISDQDDWAAPCSHTAWARSRDSMVVNDWGWRRQERFMISYKFCHAELYLELGDYILCSHVYHFTIGPISVRSYRVGDRLFVRPPNRHFLTMVRNASNFAWSFWCLSFPMSHLPSFGKSDVFDISAAEMWAQRDLSNYKTEICQFIYHNHPNCSSLRWPYAFVDSSLVVLGWELWRLKQTSSKRFLVRLKPSKRGALNYGGF